MTVFHSLIQPPRTMWQAANDMFKEACRTRDVEMWRRAYRLWMLAATMRAPGQFIPVSPHLRSWLP